MRIIQASFSPSSLKLQCDGPLTQIECKVRYTKRPYSETGAAVTCSLEDGLECIAAEDAGHCPDFETRYWCNYTGNLTLRKVVQHCSTHPYCSDSKPSPGPNFIKLLSTKICLA